MNRERGRPQLRFGEQLLILLEKEWLQMVRDPAVIFMGALLPVVLIVLFGWGLSMDLLKVPAVFTALSAEVPTLNSLKCRRGTTPKGSLRPDARKSSLICRPGSRATPRWAVLR